MNTEKQKWRQAVKEANAGLGKKGVLTAILFGQLLLKKGAKFVSALGLLAGAAGIWLFGHTTSFAVFALAIMIDRCAATAYDKNAGVALVNNWFPTRKGLVLGWSTMGVPLVNILFIPFITWGTGHLGFEKVTGIIAVVFAALAVLTILFVRNTPEECGAYPDNLPANQKSIEAARKAMANYKSPWTFKKLLTTKNVWVMSFGMGLMWLAVIGVVSQDIPRMISLGYDTTYATTVLFVCAFISVGGIPNLVPSMVGTVFGRYDFAAANRVISPICNLLFSCAYLVVSACLKVFGSYTQVYIILIVIAAVGIFLTWRTNDAMVGKLPPE